ncbi:ferritin-3, chloroplastic-like isoform X1 [Vitis riparia]|uniref:ferritin-3, chloroplastic-like isoform X1 n=1 Tax=Vitis riparia TaxID=96939 RepID=UPI00155AF660|nr:ferritin-3, chloroplastic-like isoform X1 [Vitis riparia]
MLLKSSASFSLSSSASLIGDRKNAYSSTVLQFPWRNENVFGGKFVIKASKESRKASTLGAWFDPFEEVKKERLVVPTCPQDSLSRLKFSSPCETAINEQINVEYNVSYAYHTLYAYFDRDNIALKGLAKFCKESSTEEREHAEKLMEYQNKRGGKVKLRVIVRPPSEFDNDEKGDALHAMELALALEKLTTQKLLDLHKVAVENDDPHLVDFIESEFLTEQVESIKKVAEYVAQLRRLGKGYGNFWLTWASHFLYPSSFI